MGENRVYFECGGGLGDLIMVYCSTGKEKELPTSDGYASKWFRKLKAIKTKHPSVTTIVVMQNHNAHAKELIKHDPYIDEVHQHPWVPPGAPRQKWKIMYRCVPIESRFNGDDYDVSEPKVYMNKEDRKIVDGVQGKFIVIHPFARGSVREVLTIDYYKKIIDDLVDFGYKVVVIGQSYTLQCKKGANIKERFDYEREGLINLVNRCSIRASVNLVFRCSGFIGTHSCMILAAWFKKKKTVCIVPRGKADMKFWKGDSPTVWGLHQSFNKTVYVKTGDGLYRDATKPENMPVGNVYLKEIVNYFKV